MPFKDFCGAAPASKLTYMHTVSAAVYNSFQRLTLGRSTQNHNFGQDSRIDLLVIFNSSCCRLVGQLLSPTTLDFWTSLECLLVGKDLNLSSSNIFKGATASQDQHKVESFSSNSSGTVAPLAVLNLAIDCRWPPKLAPKAVSSSLALPVGDFPGVSPRDPGRSCEQGPPFHPRIFNETTSQHSERIVQNVYMLCWNLCKRPLTVSTPGPLQQIHSSQRSPYLYIQQALASRRTFVQNLKQSTRNALHNRML